MPKVASNSQYRSRTGAVDDAQPNARFSHLTGLLSLPDLTYLSLTIDVGLKQEDYPEVQFAIVCDGIVGLQHVLVDGRRSISHLFLPGDIIDFRYSGQTPGNVVCLFGAELALVDENCLTMLEDDAHQVREMLGSSLIKHWGFATKHCTDLARKSAIEKLASYIFECQKRCPAEFNGQDRGSVHLALRRVDISDYLGLRPETLCRAFAKLKQKNLIEFNDIGHVHILNEDALRKIANGSSLDKRVVA